MDEKEKLFLERQWALLDGNKQLRSRIPITSCTVIIGLSGFYFHDKNYENLNSFWWVFAGFDLVIGVAGVIALVLVHLQYNYSSSKVGYLYKQFGMDSFWQGKAETKYPALFEGGLFLFLIGYFFISLISLLAMYAKYQFHNGVGT